MGRVLVVDDSVTLRRIVGRALKNAGFEVETASDGQEGLERVRQVRPDVVLIDFAMPRMNGLAFAKVVRKVPGLSHLPLILMSAKAPKIGARFVAQTGAVGVLAKPFGSAELLATVRQALSRDTGAHASDELETTHVGASPEDTFVGPRRGHDETGARVRPTDSVAPEAVRPSPGLSGLLEVVGLDAVLELIAGRRLTGALEVDGEGGVEITICLRRGAIDLALARGEPDEFRLGQYVLRDGRLDEAGLDALLRSLHSGGDRLGTVLVEGGCLSRGELDSLLTRQVFDRLGAGLGSTRGRFRFFLGLELAPAREARLGLPLAPLLDEARRAAMEHGAHRSRSRRSEPRLRSPEAVREVGGGGSSDQRTLPAEARVEPTDPSDAQR